MIRAVAIRILRQVPVDLPRIAKSVQRQRTARVKFLFERGKFAALPPLEDFSYVHCYATVCSV
jgi:hypothetical protein